MIITAFARASGFSCASLPCAEFFVALWACFAQDFIAVPVTPVDPFQPKSDAREKLQGIVQTCTPSVYLTVREYHQALQASAAYHESMGSAVVKELNAIAWVAIDSLDYTSAPRSAPSFPPDHVSPSSSGSSLAFLQFSSGSTGQPKGAMVSHANVCENVRSCAALTNCGVSFETYLGSIAVSWLPTFP